MVSRRAEQRRAPRRAIPRPPRKAEGGARIPKWATAPPRAWRGAGARAARREKKNVRSVAGRPSRRPCSCAPWWQRFEAPARRGGRRTRAEGRERARKRRPSSQRSALRRSARRLGTWAPRRLHGRSLRRTEAVWGGMGAPQAAQPRGSRPAPTRPKQLMQTRLLLARWRPSGGVLRQGGGAPVSRGAREHARAAPASITLHCTLSLAATIWAFQTPRL